MNILRRLMARKSVRVLAINALVLFLLVTGVRLFLPAEKIRDLALEQARTRFGREVTIGEVSVSFRGGLGVRLADFAIHNPEGFAGDPLVSAAGLDLKLAIRPLLKKEVQVHRLVLDSPRLNLVRRADGTDNFTFPKPEEMAAPAPVGSDSGPAAGTSLSVASLTLKDGRLFYTDETVAAPGLQAFLVEGFDAGLTLDDPAPGQFHTTGRATAARIVMTGPEGVPDLDAALDFDITWDQNLSKLTIAKAEGTVLDLPLNATGDVTVGEAGPTGNLRVAVPEQPVVGFKALLPPELAPKLIGDDQSGSIAGTFDVGLTGDTANAWVTRGRLNATNVDLALVQPFMPPEQPGKLAGRGDLEVNLAVAASDPAAADWKGTANLRGVSFTDAGWVDELQDLTATIGFNPDKLTVEECQAVFASAAVDLTGSLADPFPYFLPPEMQEGQDMKTPHLEFDLSSPHLDVDRLIPAASPTGPAVADDQPGMTERAPVAAGVEFPDITGAGTIRADTLVYMQVPVTSVTGKVTLEDRKLRVSDVTGVVYKGTVAGDVAIDLNDLNDPIYTGDFAARDIEVDNFATRFAGMAGVVFGGFNFGGAFETRGLDPEVIRNSLTLDADALLQEGRVVTRGATYQALSGLANKAGGSFDQEQTLRDLATHIRVEDGRVGLNDLTTRLGDVADVTVGGWYGFDGKLDYGGTLLLTADRTRALFEQGGLMGELGKLFGDERPERLALPLSVGGTRADPKVKIDMSAMMNDLQNAALKAQADKLEEEAKGKLGDLLKGWK